MHLHQLARFNSSPLIKLTQRRYLAKVGPKVYIPNQFLSPVHKKYYHVPELYQYTRGRWLIDDALERNARFLSFNYKELCALVIKNCPGAERITFLEKKEGSNTRVFIFSLDNGGKVVARLPTSVAGPKRLTTNSEVATIEFMRRNARMPVPKILSWSDDASNPIGCEYTLMDHAHGIELRKIWFKLDSSVQIDCIVNITKKLADMSRLTFPAYGSLYMRGSSVIDSESQVPIDEEFCIGPSCGKTYWDCTAGEKRYYDRVAPNRGPWKDLSSFVDGLIDAGLSRLPPPGEFDRRARRRYQGTVPEHQELLYATQRVLHQMLDDARIRDNATPILVHPDLHTSNIFVNPADPMEIKSIIDWQSASIEPAFLYALPILNFALPADYVAYIEETEKDREITTTQIWNATHEAYLHIMPHIGPLMQVDDGIFKLFKTCHRTWRDGTALLTADLINLASRWKTLGLSEPVPYTPPKGDELNTHEKRWAEFMDFQKLRQGLSSKLEADDDGWVPADRWEATQKVHKLAFDAIMESTKQPDTDMTEDDWRAIWPYDTPY